MFDNLDFPVVTTPPSGIPQFNGGKATAQRQFIVPCQFAQEFALRAIGKYYTSEVVGFDKPVLPAKFPRDEFTPSNRTKQQMRLVADSFDIEPLSKCCHNNLSNPTEEEPQLFVQCVTDIESQATLERDYYSLQNTTDCMCYVRINYREQPWDCTWEDLKNISFLNPLLLENTAVAVERSSGYDMYTMPNRNLVWADVPEGGDRMLKGDTYAYQIIPRADITVTWFNIRVGDLCCIETHLAKYRGTVNRDDFRLFEYIKNYGCQFGGYCGEWSSESASASESIYVSDTCSCEPETLMFIDWQEEQSDRTRAFCPMDTTTLKLIFKQRRIPVDVGEDGTVNMIAGFNHLLCDREVAGAATSPWQRVKVRVGGDEKDLFKLTNFDDLFRPQV